MSLSRLARGTVATALPHCTLAEAARQMVMFSVGALVIADGGSTPPRGIVTDRDIVKRIGEGADPARETLEAFTGRPVETIGADAGPAEVLARMRRHGVRRLPIVDAEGCLCGIVSLDDVLLGIGEEMADVAATLRRQFGTDHPQAAAHARSE